MKYKTSLADNAPDTKPEERVVDLAHSVSGMLQTSALALENETSGHNDVGYGVGKTLTVALGMMAQIVDGAERLERLAKVGPVYGEKQDSEVQ